MAEKWRFKNACFMPPEVSLQRLLAYDIHNICSSAGDLNYSFKEE